MILSMDDSDESETQLAVSRVWQRADYVIEIFCVQYVGDDEVYTCFCQHNSCPTCRAIENYKQSLALGVAAPPGGSELNARIEELSATLANSSLTFPAPLGSSAINFTRRAIDDVDLQNKRVLLRVDFNVPMNCGIITCNEKIIRCLPTIQHALDKGVKAVIVISHLGRPCDEKKEEYSLKPVADELEKLLGKQIQFLNDCAGQEVEAACANAAAGSIIVLENLRFHPEEEGEFNENGSWITVEPNKVYSFRRSLSKLADVYVNDTLADSRNLSSSIVGVNMPLKLSGLLLKKELSYLAMCVGAAEKPFLVIVGGVNVAGKVQLLQNLFEHATDVIFGSGLSMTFLKVICNMEIGSSKFDEQGSKVVPQLRQKATEKDVNLVFPVDFITGDKYSGNATVGFATAAGGIRSDEMGLDIGPQTILMYSEIIRKSKTVLWVGLPGVCKWAKFSSGTKSLMKTITEITESGSSTVIVGEDAMKAATKFQVKASLISNGGRASFEILEGKTLPGVKCLDAMVGTSSGQLSVSPPSPRHQ